MRKRRTKPPRPLPLGVLHVSRGSGDRARGLMRVGDRSVPVALGRSGIKADKREGDGATPRGRFRLMRIWWRPDRLPRPRTLLPARSIRADDAWCEDASDRRYNRPIKISPAGAGDRLWRKDHLYDVLIELDHNTRPRVSGRGSAIFVHVARPGLAPTAGCVALPAGELRNLLARLARGAIVEIG